MKQPITISDNLLLKLQDELDKGLTKVYPTAGLSIHSLYHDRIAKLFLIRIRVGNIHAIPNINQETIKIISHYLLEELSESFEKALGTSSTKDIIYSTQEVTEDIHPRDSRVDDSKFLIKSYVNTLTLHLHIYAQEEMVGFRY